MRSLRSLLLALVLASCSTTPAPADDAAHVDAATVDAPSVAPDAGDVDGGPCAMPDQDGDGERSMACGGLDCDDADPARYPGAVERCDVAGRDEDCDPTTFGYRDADADGHPDAACCNVASEGMRCGDDCDDASPSTHPTATEVCNTVDDDCDVAVDESVLRTFHADADADGFGASTGASEMGCTPPVGYVENAADCDDTNPFASSTTTPELCDAHDNDCDGIVDESAAAVTWYRDADGDLFGDAADPAPVVSCTMVAGHVTNAGDCDDTRVAVHPASTEICNALDDDCDARVDEAVTKLCYVDADRDGYARATAATMPIACSAACPVGSTERAPTPGSIDCDDATAGTHQGASELCNAIDDDCSTGGGADLAEDADHDLHAPPGLCAGGPYPADDCNDLDREVYPGFHACHTCTGCEDSNVCDPAGGQRYDRACYQGARDYDYDCDGQQVPQWTATTDVCASATTMEACNATGFWTDIVPACGARGPFRPCRWGSSGGCAAATSGVGRNQACR